VTCRRATADVTPRRPLTRIFVAALLSAGAGGPALADPRASPDSPELRLQLSPYTWHRAPSPEHRWVGMIGIESEHHASLAGVAFFRNSYGQPSVYVYPFGGVHSNLLGIRPLYFKWTAGLMYGYVAPYDGNVPFNHRGFSPAVVPALGLQLAPGVTAQVNVLALAALMVQVSVTLP
jgi:hypothetical protein